MPYPGAEDLSRLATSLASSLPGELKPLARVASNYRWSWMPGARDLFRSVDEGGFMAAGENPVQMLRQAAPADIQRASRDAAVVERAHALATALHAELVAPFVADGLDPGRPVAFFCAEFGIHPSLPVYAGGLGVLAGDIVKEASDLRLPLVGMGLFYRQGYLQQAFDHDGLQVESWADIDPEMLAVALATGPDGEPLTVTVPIGERPVTLQVWRADVGRIPLFLLDADRSDNAAGDRAITSRLYDGDRTIRLQQYAALGLGGMRALRALGIGPGIVHMNEGHAAFASLEMPAGARAILTTHTPVAAGNETYADAEIVGVLGKAIEQLGRTPEEVLARGRVTDAGRFELTPFGIRSSAATNAVSERHGQVARTMWRHLFPGVATDDDVPISHVTNGVHLPTWIASPVRQMLNRHLGPDWKDRSADPAAWGAVDAIPDEELWSVRSTLRAHLVGFLKEKGVDLDPEAITVGFARRVAAYKRLHLVTHDPERLRTLPLQLVLAGKAHPADDGAKEMLRSVVAFGSGAIGLARMAFVENYDLGAAATMVAGCDVWINLPTPPMEASGTSGMKAAVNGGLNLSVLDGWWEEAYDGTNGWAIASDPRLETAERDAADADALYGLLEREVLPLFHDRDAAGIPRDWLRRVKASLRTVGPRFSAARMLGDYVRSVYPER